MGTSKTNKIFILLIIDSAFFLLELTVGCAVHSLALITDSFHMLNDVLSLLIGLWAVKVRNMETTSKMYTYGLQRVETLGALVNGIFLIALCVSIFLEAMQRLVEPQEVKSPKLVCIVGCLGLLSNIIGLALSHDHSHGHGHLTAVSARTMKSSMSKQQRGSVPRHSVPSNAEAQQTSTESASLFADTQQTLETHRRFRRYSSATNRGFLDVADLQGHPATLRQEIIAASRNSFADDEQTWESTADQQGQIDNGVAEQSERTSLLRHKEQAGSYGGESVASARMAAFPINDIHNDQNHTQQKPKGHKHGHSHDLNMRGIFLHVMGDALGNIGVIASALVIWLTDYSWRSYVDPGISLAIAFTILVSAIPLCKAASRLLLQAVPSGISIDRIKENIEGLPGVIGSHHLHVWQLSDTKLVASIHIQVNTEIKEEGSERYMHLARQVRKCLHTYGIHSSTIQPEFAPESDAEDSNITLIRSTGSINDSQLNKILNRADNVQDTTPQACLLDCGEECARGGQWCPRPAP
ncbi:cation efflux protein [Aspergillus ambiguus]|uniref:cation diffusion facilitator family transporter n=1 Tax=Aspergillus ambiguus TaxID=176160 RepID=UPI003CCD6245